MALSSSLIAQLAELNGVRLSTPSGMYTGTPLGDLLRYAMEIEPLSVKKGTADPSVPPGVEANPGDLYLRDTPGVGGGELWIKIGDLDTEWSLVNTAATMALATNRIFVGNAGGVATGVDMSSEASIVASGAVTLSNAAVIGKVITGFASGAGALAATDTILEAINKLDGNTGSLDPTPANYTPTDAAIVADHLEAIDGVLGSAGLDAQSTIQVYVDNNRTDVYTPTGTIEKPFITIQDAVDHIATLVPDAYYSISVASGNYEENVVIEDTNLRRLKIVGTGNTNINPAAGNSIQSTSDNDNLTTLLVKDIALVSPLVLTGSNGAASFVNVIFDNVSFHATATINLTCINNFTWRNCYCEAPVNFSNVNFSYWESNQVQGALSATMDDTADAPSWGLAGALLANGVYQSGTVSYSMTGTVTYTVVPQGTRWGLNDVTVPAEVTYICYNSFLRGTHTNAGTIQLRNSNVQGYVDNGGTLNIDDNPSSQHFYDNAVSGLVAENVQDAIDEIAAQVVKVTKTFTDFGVPGYGVVVPLFSLPAGAAVKDVYADCTEAFTSPLHGELFTSDGTTEGSFEIADPTGFSADDYVHLSSTVPLATDGYIEKIYAGAGVAAYDEPVTTAGTVGGDVWVEDATGMTAGDYLAIENAGPADVLHGVLESITDDTAATGVAATGTLTALAPGVGGVADGQTFTINDGTTDYTYEFDMDGSATEIPVPVVATAVAATGSLTALAVGAGGVVDGQQFLIDDGAGGGPVTFEFDTDGSMPANAVTVVEGAAATGSLTALGAWTIGTPGVRVGQTFTISDGVNPYEFEFALAAGTITYPVIIADEGTAATGSIRAQAGALMTDGDTFTIDDGINPAATFEFDLGGGGVVPGNEPIAYVGTESAHEMATLIQTAINAPTVVTTNITASGAPATLLTLTNAYPGLGGNNAITEVVAAGTLHPTGFAGGLDGDDAATIHAAILAAIVVANGAGMGVTAAGASPAVDLTNTADGIAGNVAITEAVGTGTSLTPVGMAGGVTADDATAVKAAIIAAINAVGALGVTASPGAGDVVDLENDVASSAGNVAITEVLAGGTTLSPTGMAGGLDVDIDTDVQAAIVAAINGSAINVTAAPGAGADVDLTNDAAGDHGNVAITEVLGGGATLNPVGMAGGSNSFLLHLQDNTGLTPANLDLSMYLVAAGTRVYALDQYMVHVTQTVGGAGGDRDLSAYLVADAASLDRGVVWVEMEVGVAGETDKYLAGGRDLYTGPQSYLNAIDKGSALLTLGRTNIESFAVATNIVVRVDSTGDWLDELTAGSVDFYIEYTSA